MSGHCKKDVIKISIAKQAKGYQLGGSFDEQEHKCPSRTCRLRHASCKKCAGKNEFGFRPPLLPRPPFSLSPSAASVITKLTGLARFPAPPKFSQLVPRQLADPSLPSSLPSFLLPSASHYASLLRREILDRCKLSLADDERGRGKKRPLSFACFLCVSFLADAS